RRRPCKTSLEASGSFPGRRRSPPRAVARPQQGVQLGCQRSETGSPLVTAARGSAGRRGGGGLFDRTGRPPIFAFRLSTFGTSQTAFPRLLTSARSSERV